MVQKCLNCAADLDMDDIAFGVCARCRLPGTATVALNLPPTPSLEQLDFSNTPQELSRAAVSSPTDSHELTAANTPREGTLVPLLRPPDSDSGNLPTEFLDRAGAPTVVHALKPDSRLYQHFDGSPPCPPGYRLLEFIAQGAMGFVLKALDERLNRLVAIKSPLPEFVATAAARERFQREARAAAGLHHQGICPIYEVGEYQEGRYSGNPFLVMAYIAGETLEQWHARNKPNGRQSAEMLAHIARAVSAAHQSGIVHRDLKPANIMIQQKDGQPVLMDFGLAKATNETSGQMTHAGQVMGTPAYMPPEQAAGRLGEVGPLSDIYSLGAILYELLTNQPPFSGPSGAVVVQVQIAEPPAPRKLKPTIARDIETICLKAMAKNPAHRYPSAQELAADLERFAGGEAIQARREPWPTRVSRLVRRHPVASSIIAIVSMACVVILGGYYQTLRRSQELYELRQALRPEITKPLNQPMDFILCDSLIAKIKALDADESQLSQSLVTDALRSRIAAKMGQPQLGTADFEAIDGQIKQLAVRDSAAAVGLRALFVQRQSEWELVHALKSNFSNSSEFFPTAVATPDGMKLEADSTSTTASMASTLISSTGTVELEVIFTNWQESEAVGCASGTKNTKAYACTLRPKIDRDSEAFDTTLLGAVADGRESGVLQVWRAGTLLTQFPVNLRGSSSPSLTLRMRHEGAHLEFQINRNPVMLCIDPFPLPEEGMETFSLICPSPVRIAGLSVRRKHLPSVATPLDAADEYFRGAAFTQALAAYQAQTYADGTALAIRQECEYKQGLCLVQLNRGEEAMVVFDRLGSELGEPHYWPLLSLCQLWLQHQTSSREQDSATKAELVFRRITQQFTSAALAQGLPEDLRTRILEACRNSARGINIYLRDPQAITKLQRAMEVEDAIDAPLADRYELRWDLMRMQHTNGDLAAAAATGGAAIEDHRDSAFRFHNSFLAEQAWVLRRLGRPADSLKLVDRFRNELVTKDQIRVAGPLIEQVRCLAAMQEYQKAETDLDQLLRLFQPERTSYLDWASAWLLKGFLAERREDHAAAAAAWKKGTTESWRQARNNPKASLVSGQEYIYLWILLALDGSLTNKHIDEVQAVLLNTKADLQVPMELIRTVISAMRPDATRLTALVQSERGRAYARKLAFLDCSRGDVVFEPACLTAYDRILSMLHSEFDGDQDQLLWNLCHDGLEDYRAGRFRKMDRTTLVTIAALGFGTLSGESGASGWGGIVNFLPEALRPRANYFAAFHFLNLKDIEAARNLWQQSLRAAAKGDILRKLTAIELEKLEPPTAPTP